MCALYCTMCGIPCFYAVQELGPCCPPLQALQRMVLGHALCALSACPRTPDVGPGSTEDVVERAAAALRILCRQAGLGLGGLPWGPGCPPAVLLLCLMLRIHEPFCLLTRVRPCTSG